MSTYPGGYDPAIFLEPFSSTYRTHLQHLKLKGLQPKTIDAYARAIRRTGDYFDFAIDKLSPTQLTHYFSDLVAPPFLERRQTRSLRLQVLYLTRAGQTLEQPELHQAPQGSALA